ncbi:MAG: polysaccharide biosynthesis tyrosine autokinase, partial [Bacteroidales bacterium]|nr:polysaccharide biosynthesis tyrosine autokinase [Bacteroidales bacterium]
DQSDFNVMEWLMRFLHYWYLFVLGAAIALGIAMIKNRRWLPDYYSHSTIIIKDNANAMGQNSALLTGFGVDPGYKNLQNQQIILGSYDLLGRVVDSMPQLMTEYVTKGRFKTRNLYSAAPIAITRLNVTDRAMNQLYELQMLPDNRIHICSTDENRMLDVTGDFDVPIHTDDFSILVHSLQPFSGKLYFRFRTRDGLINEFMSRMQLSIVGEGSTVLRISLVGQTPDRDRDFIDHLIQIYLQKNLEQKNEVAENTIHFINRQLIDLQQSLEVSEGAMTDFRQHNKFVDVSSYAGTLMSKMTEYDQQTMQLRLREMYFDYLTNYLQTNIENGAVIAPSSLGLEEPMLMTLVTQLNELRIQRGELTEKNVYYAKFTKDIENVKMTINEVIKSMRTSMEIEKNDLNARYAQVEKEIQMLPEKELQMIAIERNYRIEDNYYTFFLQKRAEAEIQKASNTPDNIVLDKARTTSIVNNKDKKRTTTTYVVIGLLIPLVLIVISELLNNKIRTPKDIEKITKFHMIGALRHVRSQNPTLVRDMPKSSYAEMLRSIRHRLEFITKRKTNMVFMVTSTESGDGKTYMSSNMATLYAIMGKKTVLVDLDIRKPNLHTKLGVENGKGISNYLIGDCELSEAMVTTPHGFDLLRAGNIPPNPGELIHSDKMTELMHWLRDNYEFVIIDTSPIGLVPDAYAL